MASYVSTALKLGTYLVPMIRESKDPIIVFDLEMKTKDLTEVQRKDSTAQWTWREEKNYI